ncbi:hypothetical protein RVBP21_2670 [Pseudomonas phage BRkr]|nr:hypothetical protein RVBP21_2670 [Pseudomonas phage BRkr]
MWHNNEVIAYLVNSGIWAYNPGSNEWRPVNETPSGNVHGLSTGVQVNNELYLIGGFDTARHGYLSKIVPTLVAIDDVPV